MEQQDTIRIGAALIRGADEHTLLVGKRNTRTFMDLVPDELTYLGPFTAPAANEPCICHAPP